MTIKELRDECADCEKPYTTGGKTYKHTCAIELDSDAGHAAQLTRVLALIEAADRLRRVIGPTAPNLSRGEVAALDEMYVALKDLADNGDIGPIVVGQDPDTDADNDE